MEANKKNFKIEVLLAILFAIFSSILFLMYGSCQISKLHFKIQCYLMPKYLPKILLPRNYSEYNLLVVYKNYSGVWRIWDENGKLALEKSYLNGIANGREIIYFESGRISSERNYENEKLKGINREWYDSDKKQIKIEQNFSDIGTFEARAWSENGNQMEVVIFSKGNLNLAEKYFKNGNIKYKIEYVNGNKSALLTEWEETGKLKRVIEFYKGDELPAEFRQNNWSDMIFTSR